MPAGARESAIVTLLDRHGDDPIVVDAALSGLRGNEGAALEKLLQAEGPQTPQRDAAITMLAATIVRGGQDAAIQTLFGWVADDARAAWQRAALLRGAEVAVLGAPMPGGLELGDVAGHRSHRRRVQPARAHAAVPVVRTPSRRRLRRHRCAGWCA